MDNILQTALIGTANGGMALNIHTEGITLPEDASPEAQILLLSAFRSLRNKVAFQPEALETQEVLLCPTETSTYPSQAASDYFWLLLAHEKTQEIIPFVTIVLQKMVSKNWIIRPDCLLKSLQLGENHKTLRKLLLQTVGERGKWLATFHEPWGYLTTKPILDWDTGTHTERLEIFEEVFERDTEKAIEMLTLTWNTETVAQKGDYLSIITKNLAAESRPFLKGLLTNPKERSYDMKKKAAECLVLLGDKEYLAQLQNALQSLITYKSKLLSGGRFYIEAKPVPEAEALGLHPKSKTYGTPEMSVIFQMVELLPTHIWENITQHPPESIWKALTKSAEFEHWKEAIQLSAILNKSEKWLAFLLQQVVKEDAYFAHTDKMVLAFEAEAFERWMKYVNQHFVGDRVMKVLHARTQEWGNEASQAGLSILKNKIPKLVNKRPWDCHDFVAFTRNCAQFITIAQLAACRNELYKLCNQENSWLRELEQVLALIENRIKIHELFE